MSWGYDTKARFVGEDLYRSHYDDIEWCEGAFDVLHGDGVMALLHLQRCLVCDDDLAGGDERH